MKKLLLAFLFLLIVKPGFTQWSGDPNVNTPVAVQEGISENNPVPISDGEGGVIVVYTVSVWDFNNSSNNTTIYAQRISAAGLAQWDASGIQIATVPQFTYPTISTDGNGGVVILWDKNLDHVTDNSQVYGQRLNQNGNKLWGANGVEITSTPGEYWASGITYDINGFVVTYGNEEEGNNDLYAQKLDMNGSLLWGTGGVKINDAEGWAEGGLIFKDGDNYLIVFGEEYKIGENDEGMRLGWQKLNSNGTKNGTNVLLEDVFPTGGLDFYVDGFAYDGNGGFYYAITGDNDNEAKLYLQHISSTGTKSFNATPWGIEVDQSIGRLSESGYIDYGISLVSDGAGGVIVGWTDTRGGNYGLYAQRFNVSGTRVWGSGDVTVIPTLVSDRFYDGHIKMDTDGNFIFMVPKDADIEGNHLYVQKVSPSGMVLFPQAGVFAVGRSTHKYAEMVVSGNKVILVWDESGSDYNIYAQSVFSSGVLPVSLLSFNASTKFNGALLTWSTASEKSNKHFVLEKSIDGISFTPIAEIRGKENSSEKSNYQYIDKDFNKSAYYRLTQVDINGKQTIYSDLVRHLKFMSFAVVAYPNPTTENLFINTESISTNSIVKLMDVKGKVVETKTVTHSPLVFDVSSLPSGVYFVQYTDGVKMQINKVIKQ